MNLLMLLSALLSALTGVGAAVRRPEVAQSVAQLVSAREGVRTVVATEAFRPVAALRTLRSAASLDVVAVALLVPSVALWVSRRRE